MLIPKHQNSTKVSPQQTKTTILKPKNMTTAQKIEHAKKAMQGATEAEIKQMVKTTNWLQKWEKTLISLREKYQRETGETISQIEFNMFIYENDKNLPSFTEKQQAKLN